MGELSPTKEIKRNMKKPSPLKYNLKDINSLLVSDENGQSIPFETLLTNTKTDAFLIMYKGEIVYENYLNNMKTNQQHYMASVSKVFTGLVIKMLANEGKINLNTKAEAYLPELQNNPFGHATIQQLLDMQVSAEFPTHNFKQEGLSNQDAQLYLATGLLPRWKNYDGPDTIYDMLNEAVEKQAPGTAFEYNNGSAETLGWIIRRITGTSLATAVDERIWLPLATEEAAYYVIDSVGTEEASAGLNATLRDMGRFGQMILNSGTYNRKQIIPKTIIEEIQNKNNQVAVSEESKSSYTYHNQWWITNNEHDAFEVTGSYGQQLYIDPQAKMVIVHFSSNSNYTPEIQQAFSNAYIQIADYLEKAS